MGVHIKLFGSASVATASEAFEPYRSSSPSEFLLRG